MAYCYITAASTLHAVVIIHCIRPFVPLRFYGQQSALSELLLGIEDVAPE